MESSEGRKKARGEGEGCTLASLPKELIVLVVQESDAFVFNVLVRLSRRFAHYTFSKEELAQICLKAGQRKLEALGERLKGEAQDKNTLLGALQSILAGESYLLSDYLTRNALQHGSRRASNDDGVYLDISRHCTFDAYGIYNFGNYPSELKERLEQECSVVVTQFISNRTAGMKGWRGTFHFWYRERSKPGKLHLIKPEAGKTLLEHYEEQHGDDVATFDGRCVRYEMLLKDPSKVYVAKTMNMWPVERRILDERVLELERE